MLTFSRVFEQVDDFLRYCWTKFSFYMCFTTFSEALRTPRTDRDSIKGFRAQPPGKPVRMRIKMAAEVQTFVKEYVDFLTSLWNLVRINLQTAAEVQTFVEEYVNFITSLWTLARINLQTAAEVRTFVEEYVNFLTSLWTLVIINLQTAAEWRTFVKKTC